MTQTSQFGLKDLGLLLPDKVDVTNALSDAARYAPYPRLPKVVMCSFLYPLTHTPPLYSLAPLSHH